jgi:hypothetical protein
VKSESKIHHDLSFTFAGKDSGDASIIRKHNSIKTKSDLPDSFKIDWDEIQKNTNKEPEVRWELPPFLNFPIIAGMCTDHAIMFISCFYNSK